MTDEFDPGADHGGHSHGGGGGHSHGGGGHGGHGHGDIESSTKPKKQRPTSYAGAAAPTDRTPLLQPNASSSSPSPSSITDDEDDDVDEPEDELYVHPGELRGNIVKQAHEAGYGAHSHADAKKSDHSHGNGDAHGHSHGGDDEDDHEAVQGKDGAMNDYGVWLHVMGDAVSSGTRSCALDSADPSLVLQLGNIGVIAAGLFIWLTDYSWRMYSDPAVSLVITCIIFSSALPLGA